MLAGEGASGSSASPLESARRQPESALNLAPNSAAAGTKGDKASVTTPAEGLTGPAGEQHHTNTCCVPDTIHMYE